MTDTPTVEPPKADSLSIRDNRTGKEYEVAISDGTIRAADLRQIAVEVSPAGNLRPRIRQHGLSAAALSPTSTESRDPRVPRPSR